MWFRVFIGLVITLKIGMFWYFVEYGQFVDNDSALYIKLAENIVDHQVFSESSAAPFEAQVFRTPGYPAFLAALTSLGMEGSYWAVFWQELIYGFCVFLFYHFGKCLFDRNIVVAGVIFLLLDPGGLVHPKLMMSETLFLPFFFLGLFAIGIYLRESKWQNLIAAGFLFGLGTLIRPAVMYLPFAIAITLCCFDFRNIKRWLHASSFMLMFILTLSPWLVRNYLHFDTLFISSSHGNILAKYHVPIVWDAAGILPREQGNILILKRIKKAVAEQSSKIDRPLTEVEIDGVEKKLAVVELAKYPYIYLKQWIFGCIKTMSGPFITQLYDSYGIRSERVHFYDIVRQEDNFAEGVWQYFINLDLIFLVNALATLIMAGLALLGVFNIISQRNCFLWIMMLSNFYFICIPGPEGYPRFRFPVSLFWFIQAYLGFRWIAAFAQKNNSIKPVQAPD
jgi:4-amino-4-deoxy-L-arabinose transferase-like glycosyltransferase